MTTNLAIDDDLINEALTLGHFKTKEDTVITTLKEFINRRKQLEIVDLFGQFDPDPDYDYKQGRHISNTYLSSCIPSQRLDDYK
jgi:hypothetical protein